MIIMQKWKRLVTPRTEISRKLYIAVAVFTFTLLLGLWCILTYGGFVRPFFLPSPGSVLNNTIELFTEHDLLTHIRASTYRVLAGFALSALLAIPLGLLMGTYKIVEALTEPVNDFIRYMPVVAFIPLSILWLGIGDIQKIAIIFIGTFFQLVLLVSDNVSSVKNELLETAYTLGVRKHRAVLRVLFPTSLPGIFDNLRVSMGWAWSYLVVAELVASSKGIGYIIIQSQRFLKTGNVISGIIILGILGLGFDFFFKILYKILFPWTEKKMV